MPRNPNKKRCKAKKAKSTGERCKYWAVHGYDICRFHGAGGGAPGKNRNTEFAICPWRLVTVTDAKSKDG